ncbi:MAG: 3,4-dihydroxy-2-butanone-4-phosphate synthase, partial [Actinomycetota bacterium]|nr:3,4-dihydroxy-2-butanone-4-phosphate synthase [Actinomycetota bacterium]
MPLAAISDAVDAIRRGQMVVVVDDEDRENEGDLIMASEFVTPEAISFYLEHTSGLICIAVTGDRLDELDIPLMVHENTESQRTAFTVTVDAAHGTTTGISAADRATTIRTLVDPEAKPRDLARPGHILPLRYREGGVLKRQGHTEASVDLAKLAGLQPSGILCEIVTKDKVSMARFDELERFAKEHGL